MQPVNESLHHTGLSEEEREVLAEFNEVKEAAAKYPVGSAMREMLDRRLASLEIRLGI